MGQYYKPVVEKRGEKRFVLNSYLGKEWQCMKLTEHSWLRNLYVNSICQMVYKSKGRIYWVGDYCNDFESPEEIENGLTPEKINKLHELAHGEKSRKEGKPVPENPLDLTGKYLVNHKKETFVDLSKYEANNTFSEMCLHPLPLLTALGNGRGGGDYFGHYSDMCGTWAGDEISIEDFPVENFDEIELFFKEEWQNE